MVTQKRLASEYDLELVYREAFHRHYHKEIQKPSSRKLFRDIVGYQDPHTPIMSVREWEVAGIYYAFAFRKRPCDGEKPGIEQSFVPEYE